MEPCRLDSLLGRSKTIIIGYQYRAGVLVATEAFDRHEFTTGRVTKILDSAQVPSHNRGSKRLIAWFSSIVVMSVSVQPTRVLLPVYVVTMAGGDAQLTAAIFSVSMFWTAVGSLTGGIIGDAFGHRKAYLIGLSMMVVLAGAFLTTSVPAIFLLFSIFGLGMGWSSTAFQTYVVQAFPRTQTATLMGFWFSSMGMAGIAGSAVATSLVEGAGFAPIGILGLVTSAIGYILIWATVPKTRESTISPLEITKPSALKLQLPQLQRARGVLAFLGLTGIPSVFIGASSVAAPLLLFAASSSSSLVAGYGLAVALVALLAHPLIGRLADMKGLWGPMVIGAFMVVMGGLMMAIGPTTVSIIYVAGIIGLLGGGIRDILIPTIAGEVMSPSVHGRVIGLGSMTWSIGFMAGSLLTGLLLDEHPSILFWIVAAITALSLPLIQRLHSHAKHVVADSPVSPETPH